MSLVQVLQGNQLFLGSSVRRRSTFYPRVCIVPHNIYHNDPPPPEMPRSNTLVPNCEYTPDSKSFVAQQPEVDPVLPHMPMYKSVLASYVH
ncbi:hypothetical protein PAXRUDRAFT_627307 [Paxillus rubicundulus Ve08.2h10]|uniref:Uncharacterized protein n=1 Tax=Paxillus rubicundulus Ve08.2h10 TaxID=930991 RepID=A0A0D0E3D0_9AGAM|nr:hypothetical protein PAXRUDRAFT_627307 [Paxillus rubicundulus Ve08.2h10]